MKFPVFGFVLTLPFTAEVHAATTISTLDQWDGEVSPFGTPDMATYSQTITIGDQPQVLESLSLNILTDLNAPFTIEVGTWTGSWSGDLVFSINTVVAIPEQSIYGLLLVVLGLIWFAARRKMPG